MLRIALVYGLISGSIVIGISAIGISFAEPEQMTGNHAIGYLIMLIALSCIFFAVKGYRDKKHGGVIRFWPALSLGLAITAFAGLAYVIGWEIFLAVSDMDFMNAYIDATVAAKRDAGASEAEIARYLAEMETLAANYENPFFRLPVTFLEIVPVGIVVALVSAAILRNPKVLPAR